MALTTRPSLNPSCFNKTAGGYRSVLWTKSDANYIAGSDDKPLYVRAIVCSGAGNIVMELAGNAVGVTMTVPVEAGVIYPYNPIRILDATTATGIYLLL
jgi:hypothetical protein